MQICQIGKDCQNWEFTLLFLKQGQHFIAKCHYWKRSVHPIEEFMPKIVSQKKTKKNQSGDNSWNLQKNQGRKMNIKFLKFKRIFLYIPKCDRKPRKSMNFSLPTLNYETLMPWRQWKKDIDRETQTSFVILKQSFGTFSKN